MDCVCHLSHILHTRPLIHASLLILKMPCRTFGLGELQMDFCVGHQVHEWVFLTSNATRLQPGAMTDQDKVRCTATYMCGPQ